MKGGVIYGFLGGVYMGFKLDLQGREGGYVWVLNKTRMGFK